MTEIAELMKLEPPQLDSKLRDLMAEQAKGCWEYDKRPEACVKMTEPEFLLWVQGRVKEGIAISSILRRTNTGPAKSPKGSKGKVTPDLSSLTEDMLS